MSALAVPSSRWDTLPPRSGELGPVARCAAREHRRCWLDRLRAMSTEMCGIQVGAALRSSLLRARRPPGAAGPAPPPHGQPPRTAPRCCFATEAAVSGCARSLLSWTSSIRLARATGATASSAEASASQMANDALVARPMRSRVPHRPRYCIRRSSADTLVQRLQRLAAQPRVVELGSERPVGSRREHSCPCRALSADGQTG